MTIRYVRVLGLALLLVITACVFGTRTSSVHAQAPVSAVAETQPGDLNPGVCTRIFRAWSRGDDNEQSLVDGCITVMGIDQYCAARGAFVAVQCNNSQTRRWLLCSPYSDPGSVLEQADHIATGVEEGLADAMVAAA